MRASPVVLLCLCGLAACGDNIRGDDPGDDGPGAVDPDAGSDATCLPLRCEAAPTCGLLPDGCGGEIDCACAVPGSCQAPPDGAGPCQRSAWTAATVDARGDSGRSTSIAVGREVQVTYIADQGLRLARQDAAGDWEIEEVDVGVAWSTSLALEPAGGAHVAYFVLTGPFTSELRHAYRSAEGSWAIEVVDRRGQPGSSASLVIGSAGQVHVVYGERNAGALRYAVRRRGEPWSTEEVAASSLDGGNSIAVDCGGGVHVVYLGGDGALRYARPAEGRGWVTEAIDDRYSHHPALAIDRTGVLNVVAEPRDGGAGLIHAQRAGAGPWVVSDIDAAGSGSRDPALVVDLGGSPHVVYWDSAAGERNLEYVHRLETGEWIQSVADDEITVGEYASLAIDARGRLHAAYHDEYAGDLRHASSSCE